MTAPQTLDDVIARDREMGREIDLLARRLSDGASLPPLSRNAKRSLGQRRRWLIKKRHELREEFALQGLQD